jgi:hypothetical protein
MNRALLVAALVFSATSVAAQAPVVAPSGMRRAAVVIPAADSLRPSGDGLAHVFGRTVLGAGGSLVGGSVGILAGLLFGLAVIPLMGEDAFENGEVILLTGWTIGSTIGSAFLASAPQWKSPCGRDKRFRRSLLFGGLLGAVAVGIASGSGADAGDVIVNSSLVANTVGAVIGSETCK